MRLESENSLIYLIIMPPPKPASKHVANTPATATPKDGSKAPATAKAPVKDGAKGGKKGGNPKDVKPTA